MSAVLIASQHLYTLTPRTCQEVKKRFGHGKLIVSVTVPYSGVILLLQNRLKKLDL
jgi:hypothetical protein